MEKPKILPGQVIVAKGITKIDVTLPEIGLKDVIPNGSWLEQKQIQAALEARKHLIEVERIEKFGTLSHAVWRDDLQLAEVTQKAGGYWQYFGHNVGKTLYLRPEETLFLMEVNCLLLKHNDITVSLQKAYSLLLNEIMSFEKYKVYASLSRLGYKVFKHKVPKINEEKNLDHITSEDLEKQLVDTKDVGNILKQPLTDTNSASVEVVDSEQLPITEPNNSANGKDEDSKITEKESIEGTELHHNSNVLRKPPCIMEVEESEIKFESNGSDNLTSNVNNGVTESNVGANHSVSMQTNEVELHNVSTENNENQNNELKDIKSEQSMNIDDGNIVECNEENESKIKTLVEEQQNEVTDASSNITSSIVEPKNEITENITPSNVNAEDSNVDSTENVTDETQDKPIAMDTSYECSQAVADSTVESEENTTLAIDIDSTGSDIVMDLDTPKSVELINENRKTETSNTAKKDFRLSDQVSNKRHEIFQNYVTKLKKLTSRQYKPSDYKTVDKHFENVPVLIKKEVISINVPEQQYIPQNIFVNNSSYVMNLSEIKKRSIRSASTDSTAYNSSDEVNGNHVRQLRSISNTEIPQNPRFNNNLRFPPRQHLYFRPYPMWRPQNNLNYVQFNMFFQRPCYPNMYFQSRYQYQPRPTPLLRTFSFPNNSNSNITNMNDNNIRRRNRSMRANHLQSIKNLAVRLKQIIMGGSHHISNVESLHRLLFAFNTRYKARLRLTKDFEVINDETIVETIDLEDDEESKSKKRRLSQDSDKFNENLNLLRQLASKLKDLESKDKITSQHKRALSKAIKTFNKSYEADIYMNSNFEVIDKRHINIASDSETECIVEEPQKTGKRKRLRNPFNILKRRSEKEAEVKPSTSKENQDNTNDVNNIFSEDTPCSPPISKIFNENWMPNENDFGRPEVVKTNVMNSRLTDVIKEEFMLNFMKSHYEEFNNWLEVKIAYLQHLEETDIEFQTVYDKQSLTHPGIKPLIDPEDCLDSMSVLEKLRIIGNNKVTNTTITLCVDFDVYNRDVPNYKKTNPPKPHFRIICMGESSSFPSSDDLTALHSKYDDNISIVFAIVGINSVSYLQINPIDLPVYVPSNESD